MIATHLNRDHRKRENICFCTWRSRFGQDLRRSPPRTLTFCLKNFTGGMLGEVEICYARVVRSIHEDIWLQSIRKGGV